VYLQHEQSSVEKVSMELTIEQVLQQGITTYEDGKLGEAERLYEVSLQAQPAHPDANHNLGVLAVSVNKADAALSLLLPVGTGSTQLLH
jgi:thioredoxin-like negative regulator of GroEL